MNTHLDGRSAVEGRHPHECGAGDEDAEGDAVVELEGAVVDERVLLLEEAAEAADFPVHDVAPPLSGSGRRRPCSTLWRHCADADIAADLSTAHKFRHAVGGTE